MRRVGHHVDDYPQDRIVFVGIEYAEPGTLVLRRNCLPPLDVGAPAVEHRFALPVPHSHSVGLRHVGRRLVRFAFEQPKDGVLELLMRQLVLRPGDLIVVLCDSFRLFKNGGQILVGHDLVENGLRLRLSAGAKNITNGEPD